MAIVVKACLGRGNSKVGNIPTFSLPSRLTCPGASAWCIEHCYARRFERLRPFCRSFVLRLVMCVLGPNGCVFAVDLGDGGA